MDTLFALHTLATIMMAGLIWFVQLVHYPLYAMVGEEAFSAYERAHTSRITWLVAPLMGVEAVTAAMLLFLAEAGTSHTLALIGAILVIVVWGSTAFLQVPCHTKLMAGFDPIVARRLVATNWVRTAAWSLRAVIAALISKVEAA